MANHSDHRHSPPRNGKEDPSRYSEIRKVTLVSILVNSVLSLVKIVLGFVGQSQALIADGIHSLADLVSDFVVLFAAKQSTKAADDEHPYGHGRIETVVSVALGALLVAVAFGILTDAVDRILHPEELLEPTGIALFAAIFSIFANEGLFQYTIIAANRINSNMLKANAWHHRTDAISSIIASVGIAGTMAGMPLLDAVAAIGVSLMIAKVGWDIAWAALQELMDKALDAEKTDDIKAHIVSIHGVKAVHALRSRSHGGQAFVDVHILLDDPKLSVSEGHRISEVVQETLLSEIDEVTDVTVHIDAEDDENAAPCNELPLRDELMKRLETLWSDKPLHKKIRRVTLHYLNGQIFVELTLPLEMVVSAEDGKRIALEFSRLAEQDPQVAEISVHYE